MLSEDSEVYALNPVRRLECTDIVTKEVGQDEINYIKNATKDPKWKWTRKRKDPTKDDPTKVLIFTTTKEWLSTYPGQESNDCSNSSVVSSWFFKTLQPTVGMLSFDYRDKLPNCPVTANYWPWGLNTLY